MLENEKLIDEIKESMKIINFEQKKIDKLLKKLEKNNKKVKQIEIEKKEKPPSGFAKPTKVSNELCKFFNKIEGTFMARTEVTKELNIYIKKHNLSKSVWITPNKELSDLLNVTEPIKFFDIQKHINKHFV